MAERIVFFSRFFLLVAGGLGLHFLLHGLMYGCHMDGLDRGLDVDGRLDVVGLFVFVNRGRCFFYGKGGHLGVGVEEERGECETRVRRDFVFGLYGEACFGLNFFLGRIHDE